MEYEIIGGNLPAVVCKLEKGEAMFTESGGMSWMSPNIDMSTNMEGGLLGGLARKLSGESLFMTTYACTGGMGEITFSSSLPGSIVAFDLKPGESLICQKDAFMAAERSVKLEIFFRKKLGAGLFGGEGFIMQRVTGPGKVFIEIDGHVVKRQLQPGEVLKVDTGHVAAMTPSVGFNIITLKGFKNILFGGEGLFLTELRGPGDVWLQTMPIQNVAKGIIPFLPATGGSSSPFNFGE